ncbi:MAG TPA: UbiD family decarboxylase [Burkholderiales bacterium]|nr:UbiD family decarboxylase [Burkholderiales bacterium]
MSGEAQDVRGFLERYRAEHPEDVLVIDEEVSPDQEPSALIWTLAAQGRDPMLVLERVAGTKVVTNIFGSRARIARLLGCEPAAIHRTYQEKSRQACDFKVVKSGSVLEVVDERVDLARLPLLRHFETDRAPYVTNGIIVAESPGNLSYHRAMVRSSDELATSLHSRGHLWRLLAMAEERGEPLRVAMVIGAHPLFMLAASARVPFGADERRIAGGLLGAPLEVVRTPRHGIAVPAGAEIVLEGSIDPKAKVEEGPFGEFTGYSSNRTTNNLFRVETVMRRRDAILVDVAGGNSAEHLNLGRVPRESEMVEKLMERFPAVTAVHYPKSGTHFHAYVAVRQRRDGEARQVMLGLLGWDPYLKTVIAVDDDVDITDDSEVLWALATHFQPHRDVLVVDGLPGSALDPSATGAGTTSRMGLDATRGPGFEGVRARISEAAFARAQALLGKRR